MGKFTDLQSVINSKHFREVVFGKLGIGKRLSQIIPDITKLASDFIEDGKSSSFRLYFPSNVTKILVDFLNFEVVTALYDYQS